MLPLWLGEKIGLLWHEGGRWREIAPSVARHERRGAFWAADAGGAEIEVELAWEKGDGEASIGRRAAAIQVTVLPPAGGDGTLKFSGAQVYLVNESSLECVWKPHLSPLEGMVVGDKAFRSPAIVFEDERIMAALVPDLASIEGGRDVPHVMDYTVQDRRLTYGLCEYEETGHVYHELKPREIERSEPLRFRFCLVEWEKTAGQRKRDLRAVERFLWQRFGCGNMPVSGNDELLRSLEPYADYAYGWALDRWRDVAWQQFRMPDGTEVGGVVFIVRARQKPGLGYEEEWREPKSLWNQAWFCSLRSAYGYALRGKEQGRADWMEKAELALNFALSAPQTDGLFPGYYQAGEDGRWETGRWYMSGPRRPAGHEEHAHLLDASWTCWWLLKWYRDIRADERILPFVIRYAERLLKLQRDDGGFPAWVRADGSGTSPFLTESPETSAHVMLLGLLNRLRPDKRYAASALRAAGFVAESIMPEGRWEDFETYWSCSKQWECKQFGEKDARSGLYNQCSFGIYWTAEAMKEAYTLSGDAEWLDLGEQALAEASLYQQIWQAPFFPVPTVGGFGVMTSDDEWNDARQSLFALTYLDYYRLTGNESYRARAEWALRASFYMMYCPENAGVKAIYERVHPHFDERDYGFHMENFNHHDGTPVDGLGEFTIFDWGCGAAAASLAEFKRG
ncbi:hypothetical protein [Cohnella sp.]|uniref:hypothetical protein n=1 Tax=Cohnella sp. TaxID=1883426 RepID=UPI003562A79C